MSEPKSNHSHGNSSSMTIAYLLRAIYRAFRKLQLRAPFTTAHVISLVRNLRILKPDGTPYAYKTLSCVLSNADIANWKNKNSQKVLKSRWLSGNCKVYWFVAVPRCGMRRRSLVRVHQGRHC